MSFRDKVVAYDYQNRQAAPLKFEAPAKLSVFDYIALANPEEANSFLAGKGVAPAKNWKQLGGYLAMYVNQHGEQGLEEVMSLHPDKEILSDGGGQSHNFTGGTFRNCGGCASGGGYSNCSGGQNNCSGCSGKGHSNADGGTNATQNHAFLMDKNNMIGILALVAIVTIAFHYK